MRQNSYTTRIVIGILLAGVTISSLALPRKADAWTCATIGIVFVEGEECITTPITDIVSAVTNPPGTNFGSQDWIMKWIVNPAVRVIIRAVLNATTQQIVGWIQGGGGKNVGYVKNLDQALRQEADAAGGEFLNQLTDDGLRALGFTGGINLCGNIASYLRITLRTPALAQRLTCSVTDIVRNVNSFYQNFANGGWPAFIRISLEPQNNPYGAFLIALDAKLEAENRARERVSVGVQAGKGFLGFRVPVEKNCFTTVGENEGENPQGNQGPPRSVEEVSEGEGGTQGNQGPAEPSRGKQRFCSTEYETKTPGTLIADTLSKATNNGLDFANTAKDFDEAIATIINALLQKMITATFSLGGGGSSGGDSTVSGQGIFDPGLSQIKLTNEENAGVFVSQANDLLYSADATLVAINDALGTTYQAVFTTRAAITSAASSSSAVDPGLITQLATEEAKLNKLHTNAQDALAIKSGLIAFKDSLVNASEAKTVSNLAMKLPQFGSQLLQIRSDAGVSPSPALTTRDARQDTIQLAQGSIDAIQSTLNLVDLVVNQVTTVASTTPSATKQTALMVSRARLLIAGTGLRATMTQLTLQKQNLTQAPTQSEVSRLSGILVTTITNVGPLIHDATGRVRTADEVLKQ